MAWRGLVAACLVAVIGAGLPRSVPSGELRDFGSFVASARAGAEGADPYGIHPLTFHVVLPGFEVWNPNLNPPISVVLFRVFDSAPPSTAFTAWWIFSFASYLLTIALLVQRYGETGHGWLIALWALAHAGFWDTLALGQIYLPLVLCGTAAWLLLERERFLWAGLLIGFIVAMKPNFAVWPVALFLAGHRRVAVAAVATAAVLSSVPLVTHGPGIYAQWAGVILEDDNRAAFLTNASVAGFAARLGIPAFGLASGLAILAVVATWSFRHKPRPLDASAIGIVAGIAASPIAWVHYTLFLLPMFFRTRSRALLPAAALLVVPVVVVLDYLDAPLWQQATIGSAYNWAIFVCVAGCAREAIRGPAPCRLRCSRRATRLDAA